MKVIILAGGKGSRLWPLSESLIAKHFCSFGSSCSFLEQTVKRFLDHVPIDEIFCITDQERAPYVIDHIAHFGKELCANVIVEPAMRGTAPAFAYSFASLRRRKDFDPLEPILFVPSDHIFSPEEKFIEALQLAISKFPCEEIVLFGVKPTYPETGYGYLEVELPDRVHSFCEKPSLSRAKEYVEKGNYLWNTGMYLLNYETFHRLTKMHSPQLFHYLEQEDLESGFEKLPPLSIDYELTEKCKSNRVIPLDLFWTDLGSWESVYEFLEKDGDSNVVIGNISGRDTKKSFILSNKKKIITIGVEGLIVIETDEALLISKKGSSHQVKQLLES